MTERCANPKCNAELERTDPPQSCPLCGEMGRIVTVAGNATTRSITAATPRSYSMAAGAASFTVTGSSATLTVIRHWTKLLDAAERLYNTGEYGVAVVVAQTACEVIVERAMTQAFAAKKVPELEDPMLRYLSSYSLDGDRNRKFYNALTGDDMGHNPGGTIGFWQGYRKLVEHRNLTVHSGHDLPQADARADLNAAKQFVAHIEQHNKLQG